MPPLTPTHITAPAFLAALHRYPALVPPSLHALDAARYTTLPAALARRRRAHPSADPDPGLALTLAELATLVEWKLRHGTFRPTLLALVRQNADGDVRRATGEAFRLLLGRGDGGGTTEGEEEEEEEEEGVMGALRVLTRLRGVGPATASLALSVAEPGRVPFFGDEVYRWVFWGEPEAKGKGKGWDRRIGYTEKEYRKLVDGVRRVVERMRGLGLGEEELGMGEAVAVERVAWVLGRERVDCDRGVAEEVEGQKVGGKGVKREADDDESKKLAKKVKIEADEGNNENVKETGIGRKRESQAQEALAEEAPRRQTRSSARKKA